MGDIVEDGAELSAVACFLVESDGGIVGFIAKLSDEEEFAVRESDGDAIFATGDEDAIFHEVVAFGGLGFGDAFFGDGDDLDAIEIEFTQGDLCHLELSSAAVDDHEIGEIFFFFSALEAA